MGEDAIARVAAPLSERNVIDGKLAHLVGRPMASGHLGEWLEAQILGIDGSATAAGHDGRFRSGPRHGRTVNIKWYKKHYGVRGAR